jgi:phage antirepressor YoqD-like protein
MATDETTHVENEDQVNASSASNDEHMIPKSRLDEVLKANKDLQAKLEQVEKERQEQLEEQLKEQGRYKELAEQRAKELAELKPKAETVDTYEATLISVFNTQLAEIPENMRGLIPDELNTQQKLNWLSKNKALLLKPRPLDIGAGKQGGSAPETLDLTPEELETAKRFGMAPEEYAKYK